jgi:hypothetical protein
MTETITTLGTRATLLKFEPGDGPQIPQPSPGSDMVTIRLGRTAVSTMVAQAMVDKEPIEVDGRWFMVRHAAVEINGPSTYWLEPAAPH